MSTAANTLYCRKTANVRTRPYRTHTPNSSECPYFMLARKEVVSRWTRGEGGTGAPSCRTGHTHTHSDYSQHTNTRGTSQFKQVLPCVCHAETLRSAAIRVVLTYPWLRYWSRRSWTDALQLHVIAPLVTTILVVFTHTPSKQKVVGQFWWCVCEETIVLVERGERWRVRERSHHIPSWWVGIFLRVGVDQIQIET